MPEEGTGACLMKTNPAFFDSKTKQNNNKIFTGVWTHPAVIVGVYSLTSCLFLYFKGWLKWRCVTGFVNSIAVLLLFCVCVCGWFLCLLKFRVWKSQKHHVRALLFCAPQSRQGHNVWQKDPSSTSQAILLLLPLLSIVKEQAKTASPSVAQIQREKKKVLHLSE